MGGVVSGQKMTCGAGVVAVVFLEFVSQGTHQQILNHIQSPQLYMKQSQAAAHLPVLGRSFWPFLGASLDFHELTCSCLCCSMHQFICLTAAAE